MELKNILPINGPSVEEVKKYIDKYNDELIVIKCGGSVLLDPNLFDIFIKDIRCLKKNWIKSNYCSWWWSKNQKKIIRIKY